MKRIKSKALRAVAYILGVFGISATFTACYGSPIFDADEIFVSGADTEYVNGIPDIKVYSVADPEDSRKTNANGKVNIKSYYESLVFEDVDGDLNGSWKTKEVTWEELSNSDYKVVLEKKADN